VGEVVICEDCADKLSEHDAKIADQVLNILEAIVSNKKDRLFHTCTWKGKRYAYNEILRVIKQLRTNPSAVREQGIKEGWLP
jgi:hypothetical protein